MNFVEHVHAFAADEARRDSFFPKPEEGQSLVSFLSSQDFHTCAELDKVKYDTHGERNYQIVLLMQEIVSQECVCRIKQLFELFCFLQENAHFSISEALIAAIEQMKWNQVLRPQVESDHEIESDEEIQELKQRIRIRRRERLKEVS